MSTITHPTLELSPEVVEAIASSVRDTLLSAAKIPKTIEVIEQPLWTAEFVPVGQFWFENLVDDVSERLTGFSKDCRFWSVDTEEGTWVSSATKNKGLWLTLPDAAGHLSFDKYGAVMIPSTLRKVEG